MYAKQQGAATLVGFAHPTKSGSLRPENPGPAKVQSAGKTCQVFHSFSVENRKKEKIYACGKSIKSMLQQKWVQMGYPAD